MISDALLPGSDHPALLEAMQILGCRSAVLVKIEPRPYAVINECHTNVARQVAWYGGEQIKGYYIAVSESSNDWVAIKHSVWKRDNDLIDVTPVDDTRTHNVFIYGSDNLYTSVYSSNGDLKYEQRSSMEQRRMPVLRSSSCIARTQAD